MMDKGLLGKQTTYSKSSAPSFWENYLAKIKIGALVFFGIASSLAFGYFFRDFLVWGNSSLLYSFIAAAVFLIVLTLEPFFISSKEALMYVALLESIAMVGNFADKISWAFLIAFIFIFLILLSGLFNGFKELEESLRIRFWAVARLVLPKGIVVISLFVSVFSVLNFQTEPGQFFLSKGAFSKIFSVNMPLIQRIYPGIDPALTTEAVFSTIAQNQLNRLPEFQSLSKKAQEQELKKQSNLLIGNLSRYFGSEINPKLKVEDAIFEALAKKYDALPDGLKTLILMGVGVLIFLTIEALAWPIRIIVAALAFVVYEILITAGYARISVETRSKEFILLE